MRPPRRRPRPRAARSRLRWSTGRASVAVEAVLAHGELLGLKKAGGLLTPVFPAADRRREVHELLAQIAATSQREDVKARIRKPSTPVYAADPAHPGMVVEVQPDGTRILGKMEGRRFVPAALQSKGATRGSRRRL